MSRAERLLDLMQILRRHRYAITAQQLASELGISVRSVYRDIAALQRQGAKIEGSAGTGYVLRPGSTLPPLMFDTEETEALALGIRWVCDRGDPRLALAARNALAKIAAVLPAEAKRELETSGLLIGPAFDNPGGEQWLAEIRLAIRQQNRIRIQYQDEQQRSSERCLWPFALAFFDNIRVLVAWCELRQDFRHFRTDRIAGLQRLDERYPASRQQLLQQWRAQQGITTDRN